MKRLINILSFLGMALLLLVSCGREDMNWNTQPEGTGQVNLSSMNLSVNLASSEVIARSSREQNNQIQLQNYIVGIYKIEKDATETIVKEWKYAEMPEVFSLPVGSYIARAHAPKVADAQFDMPYCEGEQSFSIVKDEVTELQPIVCTLKSIMVSIKYEQQLKDIMTGGNVSVKCNEQSIVFGKDEIRSAYFQSDNSENNTVDANLKCSLIDDPSGLEDEWESDKSFTGLKAGDHLIITYEMGDANGNPSEGGIAGVGIKVIASYQIIRLDGTVNTGKEPGIDDFPEGGGGPDLGDPTIVGDHFDLANPITIGKDVTVENPLEILIKLAAPNKIKSLVVTITSTSAAFQGAVNAMFNGAFDLANPSDDIIENLTNLGLPMKEQVYNQTDVDFDVTKFTPLLNDPLFVGEHTFKIALTDQKGKKVEANLVLITTEFEN